jgi:septin family protein
MGRTVGINELMKKTFKVYEFDQDLIDTIGHAERNFKMLVWGASGNGKTTFVAQLCKKLSQFGKVYYNSCEQGESKSIQDLAKSLTLTDCKPGTFVFGDRDTYDEMMKKLKGNRAKFVVIDSLQYMKLSIDRYKQMIEEYPRKAFIIIAWAQGSNPKGDAAESIRYMVDIKVYVKGGVAFAQSRFGVTKPHYIFPKKSGQQTDLHYETAAN